MPVTRAALAALVLTAGCSGTPDPVEVDLSGLAVRDAVLAFVAAQQDDGRSAYVAPPTAAATALAGVVLALADGRDDEAGRVASARGYVVVELADGLRALVPSSLPDDRGWGLYVVRPGGRELAVEVPHPRADLGTEDLGGRLAETTRARYLLVAGAPRTAADDADVARTGDAVFTAVHQALAARGVPALQLHGFAAASLPDVDLVVSPGSSRTSPLARALADAAQTAGLAVCRAWEQRCGQLEGRRNVQGIASRDAGSAFVHLEITRDLRTDARRDEVVRLVGRALAS